jgi:hypothetical protein
LPNRRIRIGQNAEPAASLETTVPDLHRECAEFGFNFWCLTSVLAHPARARKTTAFRTSVVYRRTGFAQRGVIANIGEWVRLRALSSCEHPCEYSHGLKQIAAHFAALNNKDMAVDGDKTITFSHFLPRIDIMPHFIPAEKRRLYPVLGRLQLEDQLRRLKPSLHVYGHSHVNRKVTLDGVSYINNAFGYPHETGIALKRLLCIHEG